jgi:predicted short-subunit dehydrogenase-like oxidoreductase (DUF2520 family)
MIGLPRSAAVLGGGALGSALVPALVAAKIPVALAWDRARKPSPWSNDLHRVRHAELVLLAVSDGAVAEVCRLAAPSVGPGQLVAHCAGALDLEALRSAGRRGAQIGSLHPLRAVPPGSGPGILRGAAAGIAGDESETRERLSAVARALGMTPVEVCGSRPLYHAAAVLAAGATVALIARAIEAFRAATGASEETARRALLPLAIGALSTLEERTPSQALTGPIARGDARTVTAHRAALPRDLLPLYDELARAALRLAPSSTIERLLRKRPSAASPVPGRGSRSSPRYRPRPSEARPSASSRSPAPRARPPSPPPPAPAPRRKR